MFPQTHDLDCKDQLMCCSQISDEIPATCCSEVTLSCQTTHEDMQTFLRAKVFFFPCQVKMLLLLHPLIVFKQLDF